MKKWLQTSCWGLALFSSFTAQAQLLATTRVEPASYRQQHAPTMRLQDALLELQRIYQVDILFEEAGMGQISVPANQLDFTAPLEKNLRNLLTPNGFGYKKLSKGGYVVRRIASPKAETPR